MSLKKYRRPYCEHKTLCNKYKGEGLKNIDIPNKVISLQCSGIRKLYENSYYEWMPLYL